MLNPTKTIFTAVALAATVSLFAPTTAQAGGFSIGFSGGEDGVTMSSGFDFNDPRIRDDRAITPMHDEGEYEGGFVKLNGDDAKVHVVIEAKGHNVLLQQAHDCVMVKKIKLLIIQMYDTKKGYLRIGDAQGAARQQEQIDYWEQQRLPEAEKECGKVWF